MLKLGQKAYDRITGFEGIITAKTEWLNGCVRYALQPQKLSEKGTPIDAQWFDVEQLIGLDEHIELTKEPSGGPPIMGDPTL
jgi:hypothetical protein